MNDIFDLLLAAEALSSSAIRMLRAYAKRWHLTGFETLLDVHRFEESELADILATSLRMDRVYSIVPHEGGESSRRLLGYRKAKVWACFPNGAPLGGGRVELVIADPTQRQRLAFLRKIYPSGIDLAVGTRGDVREAIDHYFPIDEQMSFLKSRKG